jgi:hypothetical protein
MIAYGLVFFFIYRLVVRFIQNLTHADRSEAAQNSQPPPESTLNDEPAAPPDIRDAHFRDLPDDSQKSS